MDKPGGEKDPKCEGFACLRAPPFVFPPPVLPSFPTTSGFPFKTSWITEEPLGFSTRYTAPGREYRRVKTLLRGKRGEELRFVGDG